MKEKLKKNKYWILSTLNKWKSGDFSNVAADHDDVLYMQKGTIGYSTGTMSPAEEGQFILDNFRSKLK